MERKNEGEGHVSVLEGWRIRVRRAQQGHYVSHNKLDRIHYRIGIPLMILSAVVSALTFATINLAPPWDLLWFIPGVLSIVVGALASVQTFLKSQERAERHRVAAIKFSELKRRIETLKTFQHTDEQFASDLAVIQASWSQIVEESPTILPSVWEKRHNLLSDDPSNKKISP